jgi:hypothetical protein
VVLPSLLLSSSSQSKTAAAAVWPSCPERFQSAIEGKRLSIKNKKGSRVFVRAVALITGWAGGRQERPRPSASESRLIHNSSSSSRFIDLGGGPHYGAIRDVSCYLRSLALLSPQHRKKPPGPSADTEGTRTVWGSTGV